MLESANNEIRSNSTILNRRRGAIHGLFIGDALAMPVHWYYNRQALYEDYGWVTDYLAPRNPHPDSILWRSSYKAINSKSDILHNQAKHWGQKGIHYHQFLKAGENTLNVQICQLLMNAIQNNGDYDPDDFLRAYINFMTTPGSHNDTYIEEYHRHFFTNYAKGLPPRKCGVLEKHIGGIVGMIPLVIYHHQRPQKAREKAIEHLSLTHPGEQMAFACSLITDILINVINGKPIREVIIEEIESLRNPFMGHPFMKWLNEPDDRVIGTRLSTACYVEHSVPAVIYLALKYHNDFEKALIVNTNLGGDNAARGAVLGALLGAESGIGKIPNRWIDGLLDPPHDAWLR